MSESYWDVVVVGSGNAALCAALAAREKGSSVLVIEKADESMAGGTTQYTAGAMRFAYASVAERYGGSVSFVPSSKGACFELRLPRA